MAAILLMLHLMVATAAAYQHVPLFGRHEGAPVVRLPTRARELTCAESDRNSDDSEAVGGGSESLEAQFARIAQARAAGSESAPPDPTARDLPAGQPEKFNGIREIVLVDGKPVSVPRRAAPEVSLESQLRERISVTGLLFGSVLSLISLAFFFAIAGADNAASQ